MDDPSLRPPEVRSAKTGPSEVRSAEASRSEVHSTEPGPPDVLPSELRVDYGELLRRRGAREGLDETDLASTPLAQWQRWWDDANAAQEVREPNAVVLATVDDDGLPDARTVLLKDVDALGFVIYTNLDSAKAAQLAAVPTAALVMPWHAIGRSVRVRGSVEQVPRERSAAYFATRPWGSQIGAWASAQSAPVSGRHAMTEAFEAAAARWPADGSAGPVPLPENWGGFVVRPWEVEFWVGRTSRLHDRLVFVASSVTPALNEAGAWDVVRRQP